MARPESFDDLPKYARQGHLVCTVPKDYLTAFPEVGGHLLAALMAADKAGMERDGDDVVIPLTESERAQKLDEHQRMWDNGAATYEAAKAGVALDSYRQYTAKSHAGSEHLPIPKFDADGLATFPEAVAR